MKVALRKWKGRERRTQEDDLLLKYWRSVGGVIFTEVSVGDKKEPRKARRIDAVRFLRHREKRRIVRYQPQAFECRLYDAAQKGEAVQVIEAKKTLNRGVIGQVIVGKYLLRKKQRRVKVKMVVICAEKIDLLAEFCRDSDIQVKVLRKRNWSKRLQ